MKTRTAFLLGTLLFAIHATAAAVIPAAIFHYTQSAIWTAFVGCVPWLVWVYII